MHAWTAEARKEMENFDMSAMAAMKKCDCGGTCPSCSGKKPACECGDEPCSCKQTTAQIPEYMLEEMKKCYLCQTYLEDPGMMFAAKPEIIKLKTGMAVVATVNDMSQIEKYHAFEQAFHDKVEKLMETPDIDEAKKKVCMFCGQFCDLAHEGVLMEWSPTETGSMSVFVSDKPELVKKIHALAAQMKAFEQSMPKQETE
jgi:hypothetical protein